MNSLKKTQILYFRSYLLTLGIFFFTFSLYFSFVNYQRQELFNIAQLLLIIVFLCTGGTLSYLGIYGPERKIEGWANYASRHWASAFIYALAYPVYVVWKSGQNK